MKRFPVIAVMCVAVCASAYANSGDPAAASADSLEASGQLAGELTGSGVPVALGAAVIVAGSGAAVATGDSDYAEQGIRYGTAILNTPLDETGALPLSPEVIIAAPPPDVPFDSAPEPDNGGQD